MRNAPSVSYPAGHCAFWVGLLLGLGALLAGTFLLAWPALPGAARWGAGLALALWGGMAARGLLRQPLGRLHYNGIPDGFDVGGVGWAWVPSQIATPVPLDKLRVVADLQHSLLLEMSAAGPAPRWIWLSASRAPASWLALRRALMAMSPG